MNNSLVNDNCMSLCSDIKLLSSCLSRNNTNCQNARTSDEHRPSSSLSSTSCLSQKLLNKISSSLSPCLCQNYLINFYHRRTHHACNVFIYISARKNTLNSFIQATYRINTIVLFTEIETRPSRLNVNYRLPAFCLLALQVTLSLIMHIQRGLF